MKVKPSFFYVAVAGTPKAPSGVLSSTVAKSEAEVRRLVEKIYPGLKRFFITQRRF